MSTPYSPNGIIFPAQLYQHYRNPLALWLYARYLDEKGSGRVELDLGDVERSLNIKISTLRKWLCWGAKKGMWRYYQTKTNQLTIYYTSSHRLADLAGIKNFTGGVAEIGIEDFSNHRLSILATEIELQELQNKSRFAAHCEAVAKLSDKHKISKAKKLAKKPLTPEELTTIPATKMARVLWRAGIKLGVSEGFVSFGASQKGVADRRGVSPMTVSRHLSNKYRCSFSPIKEFRGCSPIEGVVINQRLSRPEGLCYDRAQASGLGFDPEICPEMAEGKVWRNREGRWFESKCKIYQPTVNLRKARFRRSRVNSEWFVPHALRKHRGWIKDKHEYWIDKKKLLIEKIEPENFSY